MDITAKRSNLRRSALFVPGGEPRKLEKSTRVGADMLVLDLEDSVSLANKDLARACVVEFLGDRSFGDCEIAVRVNSPESPYFSADLEAVLAAGVQAIMLPKSVATVKLRDLALHIERHSGASKPRLLALVETAEGISRIGEIASQSNRIDALCFGHVDFCRDMGLAEADASKGVAHHARCMVAIAARASDLDAIDSVYLDVRNDAGCRQDTLEGKQLGFTGKLCIHPEQVAIVNEIFTPTDDDVAHARRVIAANENAEKSGVGVFELDGKMVDAPIVAAQQKILERAKRARMTQD